jgi:hypothetical protein
MIEGKGAPGGEEFQAKIAALYSLAYGVKMLMKKEGKDFTVAKLEGLWWVDSDKPYTETPREEWRWKLLIRQPEFVTPEIVEKAMKEVMKKKEKVRGKGERELLKEVRFEKIREGKCIQILHVGPYSAEPETLAKMYDFMKEKGFVPSGYHHEIYLSDPRRVSEEKLKTILRQPVEYRNQLDEDRS